VRPLVCSGVAVSVLPFHHPLVAAEEYAMLDQLSGGRLVLGAGSGYLKHEFEGFYLAPWEKRARFDEALKILVQAWEGKPFSYHGLYHHVENARIAVTPLQKPHPPLWIAILQPEAAYHVGKQGQNIMLIPYATCETKDDLKVIIDAYYRGYTEAAHAGQPDIAVALHTYVSASPGSARGESEEALNRYVRSRLYAKRRSYDELEAAGLILSGDAVPGRRILRVDAHVGVNGVAPEAVPDHFVVHLTVAHPMPVPGNSALECSRWNGWNNRFAWFGSNPAPSSRT